MSYKRDQSYLVFRLSCIWPRRTVVRYWKSLSLFSNFWGGGGYSEPRGHHANSFTYTISFDTATLRSWDYDSLFSHFPREETEAYMNLPKAKLLVRGGVWIQTGSAWVKSPTPKAPLPDTRPDICPVGADIGKDQHCEG